VRQADLYIAAAEVNILNCREGCVLTAAPNAESVRIARGSRAVVLPAYQPVRRPLDCKAARQQAKGG
jgi:hypothetical protein